MAVVPPGAGAVMDALSSAAAHAVATLEALAPAQPRTRAEVIATFGDPGRRVVDASWVRANILTCRDVNGDRASMPGVPPHYYFMTHRLIEPLLREAFRRAAIAAPDYRIGRAASFVYRHERHDPSRPLSLHAWGIAVDVDSEHNRAVEYDEGARPAPWSEAWRKQWPRGLPRPFVEAFESVGWVWGGRWARYCDPMHWQWPRATA